MKETTEIEVETEAEAEVETDSEAESKASAELQLGELAENEEVVEEFDEGRPPSIYQRSYFNGHWLMYGYGCNRRTPKVEKCKCRIAGNQFICTKTLGDDCVTTGHETFRGNLPSILHGRKNYAITYVVGNARKPNSGKWRNKLHIVNINEFRSQRRRYVRDAALNKKPFKIPPPGLIPRPKPATNLYQQKYFDGHWLMYGYGCNRRTPKVEKCKCRRVGNQFICTKTLGDDCVTTGHETFRGNLPKILVARKNYPVTYVVGNARRPNSGKWRNKIHIVSINEFRSGKRRYVRDAAANKKPFVKPPPGLIPRPRPVPRPIPRPVPRPVLPKPTPKPFVPPPPGVIVPPNARPIRPRPVPRPVPVQRQVYYYYNYFLGNWNGLGYTCDAKTPQIEVVNIRYSRGNLYAMKLLGDNCVPRGKLSFEGRIPRKLWQGMRFPVKFVVGSPRYPAARQIPNTIQILDLNSFRVGRHTFYRVMGPGSAHPHGVYINMSPMVGRSLYPGPGYVKLNPRKNMRSPVRRFVIVEEDTSKPGNC